MREYGRIYTSFWNHPKVREFSADARTLALYLLTSPHSNAIGCYALSLGYAADDLSLPADPWGIDRVSAGFTELSEKGFAHRFSDGRHVCVVDYIEWNPAENPNVVRRMVKEFDQLLKDPLKYFPAMGILAQGDKVQSADRRRLENVAQTLYETLPKPFRKPVHSVPTLSLPFPDHSNSVPNGSAKSKVGAADGSSLGLGGRSEHPPQTPSEDKDKKGARESDTRNLSMAERVALATAARNKNRKEKE